MDEINIATALFCSLESIIFEINSMRRYQTEDLHVISKVR